MGQRKEFTFGQQFTLGWSPWLRSLFGVRDFTAPTSDCPPDRVTVTDEVTASVPIDWPDGWADLRLDMHATPGRQVGPSGTLRGWPVQRFAPDAIWETWTEVRYGNRTPVQVPVPLDGPAWLEGHPLRGGAWDRHMLLVCPELGEAVEMIWAVPHAQECSGWGRWRNGKLIEGRAVCRAGVSLTAHLWNRDDPPHRLAVHIAGRDDTPSTHHEHPTTGDVLRLSSEAAIRLLAETTTEEQRRWIMAATTHGLCVVDRNGNTEPHMLLAPVAGAQWAGHTLGDLDVRMTDLELATS